MPTIKVVPMPGVPGPRGERGLIGPAGSTGATGATGARGADGSDGASAYEIAVSNGFTGTEQEWLNSLAEDVSFPSPVSWTPSINATGFAQTSNAATGTYLKYGKVVVVHLNVPFTNVTNFGTGQYSVSLPFSVAHHMTIDSGTLHDTDTNSFYSMRGHVENAGDSSMTLWYQSLVTKDAEFDNNSPVTLTSDDFFHMSFVYETE
jgi:hypothetical protein